MVNRRLLVVKFGERQNLDAYFQLHGGQHPKPLCYSTVNCILLVGGGTQFSVAQVPSVGGWSQLTLVPSGLSFQMGSAQAWGASSPLSWLLSTSIQECLSETEKTKPQVKALGGILLRKETRSVFLML